MVTPSPTLKQYRMVASSTSGSKFSRFSTHWHESHREAAKDFRARWRRCGLWLLAGIWLTGLLTSLSQLSFSRITLHGLSACLPDGKFGLEPLNYRYISSSGFFEITLGFGSMSFTKVKAIDIVRDIVGFRIPFPMPY